MARTRKGPLVVNNRLVGQWPLTAESAGVVVDDRLSRRRPHAADSAGVIYGEGGGRIRRLCEVFRENLTREVRGSGNCFRTVGVSNAGI